MVSLGFHGTRLIGAVAVALPLLHGAPAAPQSDRPVHVMSKQCNEEAIRAHLDPAPFRRLVGSRFSLVLEEGKSLLLMLVQDCSQYWIDGEALGPSQEVHVWLSVDGAKDTRPVVGALLTRPTMTWLRLFHGSTNSRARDMRTAAGSVETAIEGVVLDSPAPKRGGHASLSETLIYSWRVVSSPPSVRMVGVNHDVYRRTTAGEIVLDRIQALTHVSAAASQGTLEVKGSSDMLPWIQAGTYPITVNTFFPMWARGTLGAPMPR